MFKYLHQKRVGDGWQDLSIWQMESRFLPLFLARLSSYKTPNGVTIQLKHESRVLRYDGSKPAAFQFDGSNIEKLARPDKDSDTCGR